MIGVFDSGFGGLSVLKEVVRGLPEYRYVYVGDTARAPYGPRPGDEVYQYTLEAVEFLFSRGCELIILACNTTSAEALRKIQQEYLPVHYPTRRVLGVIVPATEEAISITNNNRIGVLATEGTVRAGSFTRELQKLNASVQVFERACPKLVELVEVGDTSSPETYEAVRGYVENVLKEDIDTLILGCTHYEHLLGAIQKVIGERNIRVVSEAEVIARKLREYFARHPEIEKKIERSSERTFYTTDTTSKFEELGSVFYGEAIRPEHIRLGELSEAV
jgi:glutamate racemase